MRRDVVVATATVSAAMVASAAILAPGATSGSDPGLKITTAVETKQIPSMTSDFVKVRCPRRHHITGWGVDLFGVEINYVDRESARVLTVSVADPDGGSAEVTVQAICLKGTGGVAIRDTGESIFEGL
jgi:hypothetical protein